MSNLNGEPQPTLYTLHPLDLSSILGTIVASEKHNGSSVSIAQLAGAVVNSSQSAQLIESGFRALSIGHQLSDECRKEVTIKCAQRIPGYMSSSFEIDSRMINDEPNSQTGAILHELMEDIEEESGITLGNNEVIPQIAEFLFTGESRLEYFRGLHDAFYLGKFKTEEHNAFWGTLVAAIVPDDIGHNPDEIFSKLLGVRELPEEQKIQLVRNALTQASQTTE